MPENPVDEVTIVAYPILSLLLAAFPPVPAQFQIERISETPEGGPPPQPEPPVAPVVASVVADPAKAAAVEQARAALQSHLATATDKVATMVDSVVITFPDTKSMTGAQVKNFWNRFIWVVTDASMGAGRGGGGFREGKYYRITLSLEGIDYYKGTEGGWFYMIFHEIAHWTASGILSNKQRFQHWQANGGTGTYDYNSPDFQQNEIFANKIAKVFTDAFGLPIRIDVPFGY